MASAAGKYGSQYHDLPPGWERVTVNGRIMYVNHAEKKTQWERPLSEAWQRRPDPPSPVSYEGSPKPLPRGWEAVPMSGRTLYVNHALKKTQWERPKDASNPQPESLPPGWECVMMGKRLLYVNHALKKTQYERPRMRTTPAPPPEAPLPQGWEAAIVNGRTLYVNHATKKTQWERPAGPRPLSARRPEPPHPPAVLARHPEPSPPLYVNQGGRSRRESSSSSRTSSGEPSVVDDPPPPYSLYPPELEARNRPGTPSGTRSQTSPPAYNPRPSPRPAPFPVPRSPASSNGYSDGPPPPDMNADGFESTRSPSGPRGLFKRPGDGGQIFPVLVRTPDDTIGFTLYGEFFPIFGPERNSSKVSRRSISRQTARTIGISGMKGLTFEASSGKSTSVDLENLVFECSGYGDADGPFYELSKWDEGLLVRELHQGALRGSGYLLQSNAGRIYVRSSSIPDVGTVVKRGHLKVEGHAMVEHFLSCMGWKSISPCSNHVKTQYGNSPAYVVNDVVSLHSKRYYVQCTLSRSAKDRVLCHTMPMRMTGEVLHTIGMGRTGGDRKLGIWAQRTYGGLWYLFD